MGGEELLDLQILEPRLDHLRLLKIPPEGSHAARKAAGVCKHPLAGCRGVEPGLRHVAGRVGDWQHDA